MSLIAVLDTCVLFPAPLRDTLLRADNAKLYELRLTDDILEELRCNLIKRRASNVGDREKQIERLLSAIKMNFAEKFITNYQNYIDLMPVNVKDRHILAAAVASNAEAIITNNLKDFPAPLLAPYKIAALSPDQFLVQLLNDNPQLMTTILVEQATFLRNPPMTVSEVLDRLEHDAPNFVHIFRNKFESLGL